jgi:hypothetical protein
MEIFSSCLHKRWRRACADIGISEMSRYTVGTNFQDPNLTIRRNSQEDILCTGTGEYFPRSYSLVSSLEFPVMCDSKDSEPPTVVVQRNEARQIQRSSPNDRLKACFPYMRSGITHYRCNFSIFARIRYHVTQNYVSHRWALLQKKNWLNNVMLYLMTDRSRLQKNISIGYNGFDGQMNDQVAMISHERSCGNNNINLCIQRSHANSVPNKARRKRCTLLGWASLW